MRRVALLRGINVGGKAKVPMAALREVFEAVGCTSVETYIQSGNVAFSGPASVSAKKLEKAIEKHFKLKVPVAVRSKTQLDATIAANPYAEVDCVHVAFLLGRTKTGASDASSLTPEEFAAVGDELFFFLPDGMGVAKLPTYVARRIGVEMTIRNWRTVLKLAEMAERSN